MNLVDNNDLKVSEDLKYDVRRLGDQQNHPVIVVDNVLDDPNSFVENIIKKHPLQKNDTSGVGVFPGYQNALDLEFDELNKLVCYLINKVTDITIENPAAVPFDYQVNCLYSDVECDRICIQPHVDPALFAFVLYLNDDPAGGTSFFSHKSTGLTMMEHVDKNYKRTEEYWEYKEWQYDFFKEKRKEKVALNSNLMEKDTFEEEHFVKMEYNRMVIYPGYVWHSAMIHPDWWVDTPRIALVGSISGQGMIAE